MPSNRCMVIGCDTTHDNKSILRHRFPKNKETYSCNMSVSETADPFNSTAVIDNDAPTYEHCNSTDMSVTETSDPFNSTAVMDNDAPTYEHCNITDMSATETPDPSTSTIIIHNDVTTSNCSEIPMKPKNLFSNAKGTLEEINSTRVNDLTPRKSLPYHTSLRYRQRNSVLQQRSLNVKQRILKAERYMQPI
ncbi:hypothetical protein ACI65C_006793 [Semiaphis heraclei]